MRVEINSHNKIQEDISAARVGVRERPLVHHTRYVRVEIRAALFAGWVTVLSGTCLAIPRLRRAVLHYNKL